MNEEGNIQEKIKKQNHCHKQKLKRVCCSMSLTISEDILNTPEHTDLKSICVGPENVANAVRMNQNNKVVG